VPGLHLLRAAAGVTAMYCFYYAIANIPLADAMLLKLTAPIFMPVIAVLWLQERVTGTLALGLCVGFIGVTVVLDPSLDEHGLAVSPIALIGLLGGVLAALAKVTVRRLSRSEPTTRIVFYFALIAGASPPSRCFGHGRHRRRRPRCCSSVSRSRRPWASSR
jgi:drug/metabolite transporter (DMT)-like permease